MSISKEYERKIECFINKLPKRMYEKFGETAYTGFVTKERLSLVKAYSHEKNEMPEGMNWGKRFEYAWLFTEITIPEELDGKRVVFSAKPGECVVFVNGKIFGALDREHTHITLTYEAKVGEVFEIVMEAYAGHNGGDEILHDNYAVLIPEENITEFPEDVNQKIIKNASFGVIREEVFQLWMDIRTLYDLRHNLDDNSLRKAMIDKALTDTCDAVDIEAQTDEFLKCVKTGREILKPLLECKNGSTAPVMYATGNSHLDLEWKWTIGETRRKIARTIGNQLKLMEEYEDYKYIHSQPWTLEILKNEYPNLYKDLKKAVKDGKVIIEGGMWVESDTNLPSGESLIRQFVLGKRFIREEFGTESEILWLPDVFGISAVMPQIMKKCGIKYFMNSKVPWLYNGGDQFPCGSFIWEGTDGSEILSYMTLDYASNINPSKIFEKWNTIANKENAPVNMFVYGHGDGGGGATREHLEYLKREKNLEGMPKVITKSPNEFFEYVDNELEITRKHVGELYYATHRGTYTSQALTKKLNRNAEFSLRETELWSALFGKNDVKDKLEPLWKEVLFNQFHDVIPGSSISEVYERANNAYQNVIAVSERVCDEVLDGVIKPKSDCITVFNSLSWERMVKIIVPDGYDTVCDNNGNHMPTQCEAGKIVALVKVPSCGFATYRLENTGKVNETLNDSLLLENAFIRAEFNQKGEIISFFDKGKNMEFLSKPSNVFKMYQDMPLFFDAWDIDSFYEKTEVSLDDAPKVIPEYKGDVEQSLIIRRKLNNSELKQRVVLRADAKRLDFETEIDYREDHKLLKVDFNTNIQTDEMISEIQFGYVKRPNHQNKQYDCDRFEVWQHKWSALAESKRGVAVLNDCKYGISADGGKMSLTLLKSACSPDLNADKGIHKFTYSLMMFTQNIADSDVVREGYELNCNPLVKRGESGRKSLFDISEKNIIIDTIKPAEDGSSDIIVRLYECMNTLTSCELLAGFDVKEAYITDMLENNKCKLDVADNKIKLKLTSFEVVTLRLKL